MNQCLFTLCSLEIQREDTYWYAMVVTESLKMNQRTFNSDVAIVIPEFTFKHKNNLSLDPGDIA